MTSTAPTPPETQADARAGERLERSSEPVPEPAPDSTPETRTEPSDAAQDRADDMADDAADDTAEDTVTESSSDSRADTYADTRADTRADTDDPAGESLTRESAADPAPRPAPDPAPEPAPPRAPGPASSTRRLPTLGVPAVVRGRARPLIAALLAGLIMGGAVFAFFATRPGEWSSRVTLVAAADTDTSASSDSGALGTIANLTLPGVEAVATSGSVLTAVSRTVPGSPSAEELARVLTVQIVPTSAVVRIAVVTDDPAVSRAIVRAVAQRVVSADLLAPVGTFSVVDSDPSARKVAPDLLSGAGFALVAGVGMAGAVLVLLILAKPGLISAAAIRRVLDDPTIGVVDLDEPGGRSMVEALLGPVHPQLLPVGRTDDATLDVAAATLDPSADGSSSKNLVLVAQRGRVSRAELHTAVVLARRSGRVVNALLVV